MVDHSQRSSELDCPANQVLSVPDSPAAACHQAAIRDSASGSTVAKSPAKLGWARSSSDCVVASTASRIASSQAVLCPPSAVSCAKQCGSSAAAAGCVVAELLTMS